MDLQRIQPQRQLLGPQSQQRITPEKNRKSRAVLRNYSVMRHARLGKSFVFLFLACAGFAAAQSTIGSVMTAGSRVASGQFYGIAQGALFAINGKGVGP